MKKFLTLAVLVLSFGTVQLSHAVGLGLEYNWGNNGAGDIGITYKDGNFPVIDLSLALGGTYLGIGANVDYWILNPHLVGPLDWYLAIGGFGSIGLGNDYFRFNLGARLPVLGLQWWPIQKSLEVFLEGALAINVIDLGTGTSSPIDINFGPALGLGFRVHF
jgi:hypothetical protein